MVEKRLMVLADFPEERWPSMDLCAEMLVRHLTAEQDQHFRVCRWCPPFRHRLDRLPILKKRAFNADRLINRFWDYPRALRARVGCFDLFHIADHSYSQLALALPPGRTGVFCYDLDAFRCLLEPARESRPRWFRAMARRILKGLQKAAVVFHATLEVRRQLERHGLVDPARLVHAPLGLSPEFTLESPEGEPAEELIPGLGGVPFLLHVGSCIPRKRIDLLLEIFACLREQHPGLWLIQIGGRWHESHYAQLRRLGILSAVVQLTGLTREDIAGFYRWAALTVLPSAAEGFGLPIIEALACGSPVLASDLPVFREVGGPAVVYAPLADVGAWVETASRLLADPLLAPPLAVRLAQARSFSWSSHARIIAEAYRRLDVG